ncbi:ABC transporter permease [Pseudobutyrivibrio sp. YE44]|uniref:ABC transporter permease n=1 Tax=Pseudobutyrivibrio sp. YE44 TaxID=1520802 RepID=UPI001FA6D17E|nr:ABC transporter permease [Pseudobutyrivibrio sp. YE44]
MSRRKQWNDTVIGSTFEGFIPIIFLFTLWIYVVNKGTVNTVVLPTPNMVLNTLSTKIVNGSLLAELGVSIVRVLEGYFLSAFFGIGLGILVGLSKNMQKLTDIVIQVLRPIPPIAWIPLVILWMGIGESSKIFLIFLGGFFTNLINVSEGILYTDSKILEVARVLETPKWKVITQVIIPAALPSIFTGLRVSLGSCWSCVVAAELVASTSGIGYMISNARNYGQMDTVIVGMLAIGVVGKLMDVFLKWIESKVLAWNIS